MKKYETMQDIYFKYNKPLGLIRGVKKKFPMQNIKKLRNFTATLKTSKIKPN